MLFLKHWDLLKATKKIHSWLKTHINFLVSSRYSSLVKYMAVLILNRFTRRVQIGPKQRNVKGFNPTIFQLHLLSLSLFHSLLVFLFTLFWLIKDYFCHTVFPSHLFYLSVRLVDK
jgi:hypothetical protein